MAVPLKLEAPAPIIDPCAALMADDTKLSRIAMEFARDLVPAVQILAAYNITQEDFNEVIINSAAFKRYFAEYQAIWNSETSTQLRFTMKAGAIVEDWLKEAHTLLHDRQQPLTAKVELAKKLMDVAGFAEVHSPKNGHGGSGGQSSVIINLGHGREKIVITKEVIPEDRLEPVPIDGTVLNMSPPPLPSGVTDMVDGQNRFPGRKL